MAPYLSELLGEITPDKRRVLRALVKAHAILVEQVAAGLYPLPPPDPRPSPVEAQTE